MSRQNRVRPGRLLAILMATVAFAALMTQVTCALAAEADPNAPLDAAATAQLLQQLSSSPVDESVCTSLCHGNIAATKNYASSIKFTHGNHIIVQCSSCHTKFPHQQSGTSRPTMKGCFDCHGLRHGSMGEIAKGNCDAVSRRTSLADELPLREDTSLTGPARGMSSPARRSSTPTACVATPRRLHDMPRR